jgi:hypothetical protein
MAQTNTQAPAATAADAPNAMVAAARSYRPAIPLPAAPLSYEFPKSHPKAERARPPGSSTARSTLSPISSSQCCRRPLKSTISARRQTRTWRQAPRSCGWPVLRRPRSWQTRRPPTGCWPRRRAHQPAPAWIPSRSRTHLSHVARIAPRLTRAPPGDTHLLIAAAKRLDIWPPSQRAMDPRSGVDPVATPSATSPSAGRRPALTAMHVLAQALSYPARLWRALRAAPNPTNIHRAEIVYFESSSDELPQRRQPQRPRHTSDRDTEQD